MLVKGLVVMDVDSTLILEEGIDLLGQEAGVGEEIAAITEAAMQGELDFQEALEKRVSLLEGLSMTVFERVMKSIHFTPGAASLVQELKKRSYKIALVSGGFHEMVDSLAEQLGFDEVRANRLEIEDGRLTGRVLGDVVTKETKKECLLAWADKYGLSLSQTIAMGDGANDLPMIQTAGIGVAFCAKPIVQEQAPYKINEKNLYHLIEIIDQLENNES